MRAEHALISGPSDAGKSSLLREGQANFNGQSIIVNHAEGEKDEFAEGFAGFHCRGRESMHAGASEFDEWQDVKLNLRIPDAERGLRVAINHAIDTWDTAGVPTQIIVDECQHILHEDVNGDMSNPANWALSEGRDKGIKLVLATQNPKVLDYTQLPNCRYWAWVGEYTAFQKAFFRHYGFPMDKIKEQDRFEYRVFNRSMQEIYHGKTKERYA